MDNAFSQWLGVKHFVREHCKAIVFEEGSMLRLKAPNLLESRFARPS